MHLLILLPILAALAILEIFIGGARLLYAVPAVLCLSIAALFSALPSIKTSQRANVAAVTTALVFAIAIGLRNRFSEVEYIGRLQFFILTGCLLIYLIFTLVLTRTAQRQALLLFLGILALLQLIPAVIQFTQGNQWMPLFWAQRLDSGSWRASGFFICPNHFAGFLEVMALMATSYAIWGRITIFSRIICGYSALLLIGGVAVSGSRGGYLSLTFGLSLLVVLSFITSLRMKRGHFILVTMIASVVLTTVLAGVLFFTFQSPHLAERVAQINDPENCRLLLWSAALQQFHLSPLWGTGGFSYLYYGRLFRDASIQNDPIHVHNDYLQLLAEYGIVGAIIFALFLFAHLSSGLSSFRKLCTLEPRRSDDLTSDRLALNIGALSAVGAYLVHSLVDFNMHLPLNAFTMAVLLALLANPGGPSEASDTTFSRDLFRKIIRYSLPLLGLGTMIYGLPMIRGEYQAERARVALRDGDPEKALELAKQGTLSRHDNPDLYYYQGEAALELALLEPKDDLSPSPTKQEAVESFTAGLKVFPYDSRLALKLAQALAASGNYSAANDSIDLAEKIDPNSSLVQAYRGMIAYAFGYFSEAKLSFEKVQKMGGEEALVIARKGLKGIETQTSVGQSPPAN